MGITTSGRSCRPNSWGGRGNSGGKRNPGSTDANPPLMQTLVPLMQTLVPLMQTLVPLIGPRTGQPGRRPGRPAPGRIVEAGTSASWGSRPQSTLQSSHRRLPDQGRAESDSRGSTSRPGPPGNGPAAGSWSCQSSCAHASTLWASRPQRNGQSSPTAGGGFSRLRGGGGARGRGDAVPETAGARRGLRIVRAHRDAARTAPASDAERGGPCSPHSAEPIPSSGPRPVFPLKRALAKKCPGEFRDDRELPGAFSGVYPQAHRAENELTSAGAGAIRCDAMKSPRAAPQWIRPLWTHGCQMRGSRGRSGPGALAIPTELRAVGLALSLGEPGFSWAASGFTLHP